jgi:hypothetical protein
MHAGRGAGGQEGGAGSGAPGCCGSMHAPQHRPARTHGTLHAPPICTRPMRGAPPGNHSCGALDPFVWVLVQLPMWWVVTPCVTAIQGPKRTMQRRGPPARGACRPAGPKCVRSCATLRARALSRRGPAARCAVHWRRAGACSWPAARPCARPKSCSAKSVENRAVENGAVCKPWSP